MGVGLGRMHCLLLLLLPRSASTHLRHLRVRLHGKGTVRIDIHTFHVAICLLLLLRMVVVVVVVVHGRVRWRKCPLRRMP